MATSWRNPFRSGCRPVFALVGIALLFLASGAFAGAEKKFPDFDFAVSLPDGWQEIADTAAQGGLAAGFCSADQTRMFLVFRDDRAPSTGELDDRFVTDYEQKIESTGGGKRLSGKFVNVQGIKSYERTGAGMFRGHMVTTLSRNIPLANHMYLLRAMRWDDERAEDDPAIQELMESFHFLSRPLTQDLVSVVPTTPTAPPMTTAPAVTVDHDPGKPFEPKQASGNDLGPPLITLAIVGGSFFVIVLIIAVMARRQKKQAPRVMPPPSPPAKAPAPPRPSPAISFAPPPFSKTTAPSPAKPPMAPFLSRPPAATPLAKATTPARPTAAVTPPAPAKTPTVPPVAIAPKTTPPAPVSAPPPPPPVPTSSCSPSQPEPPPAAPTPPKESAPPQEPAPAPFVIRPWRTFRRE